MIDTNNLTALEAQVWAEKRQREIGGSLEKLNRGKEIKRYDLHKLGLHQQTTIDIEESRRNYTIINLLKYLYVSGLDIEIKERKGRSEKK